jgi:hypothetical protein
MQASGLCRQPKARRNRPKSPLIPRDSEQVPSAAVGALRVEEDAPPPASRGYNAQLPSEGDLTRWETEVLGLTASGLPDREIAERLVLSPHRSSPRRQHPDQARTADPRPRSRSPRSPGTTALIGLSHNIRFPTSVLWHVHTDREAAQHRVMESTDPDSRCKSRWGLQALSGTNDKRASLDTAVLCSRVPATRAFWANECLTRDDPQRPSSCCPDRKSKYYPSPRLLRQTSPFPNRHPA